MDVANRGDSYVCPPSYTDLTCAALSIQSTSPLGETLDHSRDRLTGPATPGPRAQYSVQAIKEERISRSLPPRGYVPLKFVFVSVCAPRYLDPGSHVRTISDIEVLPGRS